MEVTEDSKKIRGVATAAAIRPRGQIFRQEIEGWPERILEGVGDVLTDSLGGGMLRQEHRQNEGQASRQSGERRRPVDPRRRRH